MYTDCNSFYVDFKPSLLYYGDSIKSSISINGTCIYSSQSSSGGYIGSFRDLYNRPCNVKKVQEANNTTVVYKLLFLFTYDQKTTNLSIRQDFVEVQCVVTNHQNVTSLIAFSSLNRKAGQTSGKVTFVIFCILILNCFKVNCMFWRDWTFIKYSVLAVFRF